MCKIKHCRNTNSKSIIDFQRQNKHSFWLHYYSLMYDLWISSKHDQVKIRILYQFFIPLRHSSIMISDQTFLTKVKSVFLRIDQKIGICRKCQRLQLGKPSKPIKDCFTHIITMLHFHRGA